MEYKYTVRIVRVMDLFPSIVQLATTALQLTPPMARGKSRQNASRQQHPPPPPLPSLKLATVEEQQEKEIEERSREKSPEQNTPTQESPQPKAEPPSEQTTIATSTPQPPPPPPPPPPKDLMSFSSSVQRSPESTFSTALDGTPSFTHQFSYPPEVAEADDVLIQMKSSLGMLEVQFLLIQIL